MKDKINIDTGREGENIATAYLKEKGYRICETNFRCALGEIDIIARDGNDLVFVEVKTRKSRKLGYPEQAVGGRKQRKISLLALWYLQKKKIGDIRARFDVVAITMLPEGREIRLIKNAFDFVES
jgi:putative endonuclease